MNEPNAPALGVYIDNFEGITLRDCFAAQAMHALLCNEENRSRSLEDARTNERKLFDEIAGSAYEMADAMLAARESK